MKTALPRTAAASAASATAPSALCHSRANDTVGARPAVPAKGTRTRPWPSAGPGSAALLAVARHAASASAGQRWPPASCHSGRRRSMPSASSGVVTMPLRGGRPGAGQIDSAGGTMAGQCSAGSRCAPPSAGGAGTAGRASMDLCRPAAASTTSAPGRASDRASAASPVRGPMNSRLITITRAPISRRWSTTMASASRWKGQRPSCGPSAASAASAKSTTCTPARGCAAGRPRSRASPSGRDSAACQGDAATSKPAANAPSAIQASRRHRSRATGCVNQTSSSRAGSSHHHPPDAPDAACGTSIYWAAPKTPASPSASMACTRTW